MTALVVIARIVEHADDLFVVVVSTAPQGAVDPATVTDVELGDARTREQAVIRQNRLIGLVVDRAERRGDQIVRVKRI